MRRIAPACPGLSLHAPRPQPAPPIAELADDEPFDARGRTEDDYVDEDEPERRGGAWRR